MLLAELAEQLNKIWKKYYGLGVWMAKEEQSQEEKPQQRLTYRDQVSELSVFQNVTALSKGLSLHEVLILILELAIYARFTCELKKQATNPFPHMDFSISNISKLEAEAIEEYFLLSGVRAQEIKKAFIRYYKISDDSAGCLVIQTKQLNEQNKEKFTIISAQNTTEETQKELSSKMRQLTKQLNESEASTIAFFNEGNLELKLNLKGKAKLLEVLEMIGSQTPTIARRKSSIDIDITDSELVLSISSSPIFTKPPEEVSTHTAKPVSDMQPRSDSHPKNNKGKNKKLTIVDPKFFAPPSSSLKETVSSVSVDNAQTQIDSHKHQCCIIV